MALKFRLAGIIVGALIILNLPILAAMARFDVDESTNQYPALQNFLNREGFWQEEVQAVLEPLAGVLDSTHGTPDAHLVQTLDDIPGLRPLPDGVTEFLRGPYSVYYVAVGDSRWLVGIAQVGSDEQGKALSSQYRFKKFDLIEGTTDAMLETRGQRNGATSFLWAHGSFFGPTLRILAVGVVVLIFLAARLRREKGQAADRVVAAYRFAADALIFQVTGGIWIALLAAAYGLMHFSARIGFMEMAAASDTLSPVLTRLLGTAPDQIRLLSFAVTMGLALMVVIVLGVWSGVWRGVSHEGHPLEDEKPTGGRP